MFLVSFVVLDAYFHSLFLHCGEGGGEELHRYCLFFFLQVLTLDLCAGPSPVKGIFASRSRHTDNCVQRHYYRLPTVRTFEFFVYENFTSKRVTTAYVQIITRIFQISTRRPCCICLLWNSNSIPFVTRCEWVLLWNVTENSIFNLVVRPCSISVGRPVPVTVPLKVHLY